MVNYQPFVTGALLSFVLSFGLTYWFSQLARRYQAFMPVIKTRDSHQTPTPRIGGLAIVITFLVVVIGWLVFRPSQIQLTDQHWHGLDKNILGVLTAVLILTAINLRDDYRAVAWPIRLLFQTLAALIIAWFGIGIHWISNPFGGHILLGQLSWVFVVIWLVILGNVINWLDGIDGLASGVSAIALAVLFFLSLSPTVFQHANALLAAITFGAVLGFLPHNLLSKVFLGDTGAVFLGFLIGVLAIISGGKIATAFLALAIPFLDAAVVFFSRLLHGQSPFLPDRRHLHHRLLELGWKRWQIVGLFYVVSLLFGLIALNTQTLGKFWAVVAALTLMAGLVGLYSWGHKIMPVAVEVNHESSK